MHTSMNDKYALVDYTLNFIDLWSLDPENEQLRCERRINGY